MVVYGVSFLRKANIVPVQLNDRCRSRKEDDRTERSTLLRASHRYTLGLKPGLAGSSDGPEGISWETKV